MRIYTRGGDKGKTGIHGGERVDKDDIRIEANGTLDEFERRDRHCPYVAASRS